MRSYLVRCESWVWQASLSESSVICRMFLCSVGEPSLRSLIAGACASQKLLFVRLEAPLFVPARARCTRRAEIGSRRAAGPRAAAHSGLDAIEHGASLEVKSGVVAAGSWFFPLSARTQTAATWRSPRPVLLMSRARSPLSCGRREESGATEPRLDRDTLPSLGGAELLAAQPRAAGSAPQSKLRSFFHSVWSRPRY
jgi:hypothetical protein